MGQGVESLHCYESVERLWNGLSESSCIGKTCFGAMIIPAVVVGGLSILSKKLSFGPFRFFRTCGQKRKNLLFCRFPKPDFLFG